MVKICRKDKKRTQIKKTAKKVGNSTLHMEVILIKKNKISCLLVDDIAEVVVTDLYQCKEQLMLQYYVSALL